MPKQIFRNLLRLFIWIGYYVIAIKAQAANGDELTNGVHKIANALGFTTIESTSEAAQERFGNLVGTIIEAFLIVLGVVFIIFIFSAGFMWMTARGDEEKVRKAQEIIKTSVAGIIIVAFAYAVTRIVGLLLNQTGLFQGTSATP